MAKSILEKLGGKYERQKSLLLFSGEFCEYN